MCGCSNPAKISRKMARTKRFSTKNVTEQIPYGVGGLGGLAVGGTIDNLIPVEDKKIKGAIKTAMGLAIIGMFSSKVAAGFGTVLAATGLGQVVNGFMGDNPIPGLGEPGYDTRHRIFRSHSNGKLNVNVM